MTTIDFTYCPCPIVCGQKATFTSTVTGDPAEPVYSWDFGDCTKGSSDPNPCHIFKCPGTYTVKVTLTSGSETVEYTKCVVVVASFWSSFLTILIFVIIVALIVSIIWYFFFRSTPTCANMEASPETTTVCKTTTCRRGGRKSSSF